MKDKIIMFTALAAVLAIGFIGLVNVDSNTGASMVENRYCRCTYLPTYSYNVPSGGGFEGLESQDVQPITKIIRVDDAAQQANCYQFCGSYAHRGMQLRDAEPAGLGGAPVSTIGYHAPEY
ncbi:hypothetical protein KY329_00745 [Candidatus Woesearchaeota archaeon]|nr:hypothetical protein [Candidatus Woesearchaeota archaeon]